MILPTHQCYSVLLEQSPGVAIHVCVPSHAWTLADTHIYTPLVLLKHKEMRLIDKQMDKYYCSLSQFRTPYPKHVFNLPISIQPSQGESRPCRPLCLLVSLPSTSPCLAVLPHLLVSLHFPSPDIAPIIPLALICSLAFHIVVLHLDSVPKFICSQFSYQIPCWNPPQLSLNQTCHSPSGSGITLLSVDPIILPRLQFVILGLKPLHTFLLCPQLKQKFFSIGSQSQLEAGEEERFLFPLKLPGSFWWVTSGFLLYLDSRGVSATTAGSNFTNSWRTSLAKGPCPLLSCVYFFLHIPPLYKGSYFLCLLSLWYLSASFVFSDI